MRPHTSRSLRFPAALSTIASILERTSFIPPPSPHTSS